MSQELAVQGIDRLIRNVRTGRFERSLSLLTAAGNLPACAVRQGRPAAGQADEGPSYGVGP